MTRPTPAAVALPARGQCAQPRRAAPQVCPLYYMKYGTCARFTVYCMNEERCGGRKSTVILDDVVGVWKYRLQRGHPGWRRNGTGGGAAGPRRSIRGPLYGCFFTSIDV